MLVQPAFGLRAGLEEDRKPKRQGGETSLLLPLASPAASGRHA